MRRTLLAGASSAAAAFAFLLSPNAQGAEVAMPVISAENAAVTPLPESVPSNLPRTARPVHYAIQIQPDAKALTFGASAAIDLQVFQASKTLVLNGNELTVTRARLVPAGGGKALDLQVAADAEAQTLTFTAPSAIAKGRYRLELAYTGVIGRQAAGLFALDYPDPATGKDVRGLFTQFEAPDARRFVPSFDEPAYKATFDLSAVVPADQMAIGNMPITKTEDLGNGTKRVTFATTPRMSSYLLFFATGEFERAAMKAADGVETGIVGPKGTGAQMGYARDAMAEVLPYYDDYFGVRFPLPKLDNVAAPGASQFFSAMENWGAIMTFQRLLLLDPKLTSPSIKQGIYSVQAHEMAHQWFGDLVTMAWWDDIWLNEGFASWMAAKATAHFNPDWNWLLGQIDGREGAMAQDALPTTHPVVQHVRTTSEMEQAFDGITYEKGQAVITMLEHYVGEDTWRAGLRGYMKTHAFANTQSKDLWSAIEQAGGKDVNRIAQAFTTQPGVPLVRVESVSCQGGKTTLQLSQGEFSTRNTTGETQSLWPIPLLLSAQESKDGDVQHLMTARRETVTLEGCGPVLVNAGQLGYYRTLYSKEALAALVKDFAGLSSINQYGLIRDNIALASSGYQDMGAGLDLMAAVPAKVDPVMAGNLAGLWASFYDVLEAPADKAALATFASARFAPRLKALGYDPVAGEPLVDTALRGDLIRRLGAMGDPEVVAEARRRFRLLASDPHALDGPLKATWLAVAAKNASAQDWALMKQLAVGAGSIVERQMYYAAMGSAKDEALAKQTLELAISGTPDATSGSQMIVAVAGDHPDLAWEFVRAHGKETDALISSSGRPRFQAALVRNSSDPAMATKLEAFAATLPEDQAKPINQALSRLEERLKNRPRIRAQIAAWLAQR
ncbi:M1 family metallopeptidase [Novosphingobium profundi]|uniref:M1 family metallopeptidase n=1 Tax=Novosphingobium profundi TaxID=1774954 RepID=UPI001BDB291A|nr:M1 family metallopeptidase [Novosphingobium profundi]MBT0670711.1 M1 family metallopeptidase [Novosphingobium profundi]